MPLYFLTHSWIHLQMKGRNWIATLMYTWWNGVNWLKDINKNPVYVFLCFFCIPIRQNYWYKLSTSFILKQRAYVSPVETENVTVEQSFWGWLGVCWADKVCACMCVCVLQGVGITVSEEPTCMDCSSSPHNLFYISSSFLSPPLLYHPLFIPGRILLQIIIWANSSVVYYLIFA